ncbi:amino acid adenylation domain-containing protein [Streptomyces clavuligerus]|uniref:Proline adenylation protein n=1 Tax=Streptomyces clavuligerus TaxID=1901 RepID=B5GRZ4_STRCL|nr:amino acid adenylation domain-containing protein [Streptomyces clavuligerus]EDY49090.1 amino acid adenyltransferase [Streptomyces clavuligerus]EFG03786.1 Proline adenylation protein [Streptomyces clavuligerus]MBY6307684.1 amino acid adenylation domain-containing protein [Streptomyces clavuligerus]QCS09769.1 D-alanine--poly(phosphoribitol) ligase [Streptomyces clavuligerus]QPJ98188.1 amino acid adenylation domain-containing protein [Streptomyces clavuligerus]
MSTGAQAAPGALHELLRRAATAHPARLAVVDGPREYSYAELDDRSDRLAALLERTGVGPGDRVGLHLDKSFEAIVGIYGALKAGACYVPLDPQAPESRLRVIAEDCGITVLLTGPRRVGGAGLTGLPRLKAVIDLTVDEVRDGTSAGPVTERPAGTAGPEDLAYILCTSGSTGRPKGVTLTHGNALAFVDWAVTAFGLTPEDRLSGHAPLHFDLSVFDVFGAAAGAATLVLVDSRAAVFPVELTDFIRRNRLTVWYSVPSALTLLLRQGGLTEGCFPDLRLVLFAGEVFPSPVLREVMGLLPGARFVNLYGPTETNVCTWYEVTEPPASDGSLPIGRAIEGVETAAVTDTGCVAGPGEVGELLVSGPTVMRGYWGDPQRTDEVLVPAPEGFIRPLAYRTGDLVRVGTDGNLTFLGRRDHQVKTRGYRVELGEVEAALNAQPAVAECAVIAVPDELVTHRLVACVVPAGEVKAARLARDSRNRLPRYMVPDRFEFFDELPRTSTDKTDRRALAEEVARRRSAAGI